MNLTVTERDLWEEYNRLLLKSAMMSLSPRKRWGVFPNCSENKQLRGMEQRMHEIWDELFN